MTCVMPLFDARLKSLKEETEVQFASIAQRIDGLVDSNRDMVGLLRTSPGGNNGTVQLNTQQSLDGTVAGPQRLTSVFQPSIPSQQPVVSKSQGSDSIAGSSRDIQTSSGARQLHQRRRNFVRGTAPSSAVAVGSVQTTFAAVARRAHLYVGNINPNTDRDTIVDYIGQKVPSEVFTLEELPKRDEALSRAFKLTVDFASMETFNKADFWPQGVIVKRFFRPKPKQ